MYHRQPTTSASSRTTAAIILIGNQQPLSAVIKRVDSRGTELVHEEHEDALEVAYVVVDDFPHGVFTDVVQVEAPLYNVVYET